MSYIIAIETALPKYCHQQKDITHFFIGATEDTIVKRKLKYVSEKSGITTRYSAINDFSLTEQENTSLTQIDKLSVQSSNTILNLKNTIPSLEKRMAVYQSEALPLTLQAIGKIKNIEKIKSSITHVITVTCTGLFAPGLDIQIIQAMQLKPSIERYSINFMGCNAAILALKQANDICNSTAKATVLIVCVELCTIHFQHNNADDNILSNTLFGDGAAATLVSSAIPKQVDAPVLNIKSFHSLIISKGFNDMAWQLSSTGFLMNLTSYVSELINGSMNEFLKNIELNKNDINYWAIHPGGKKIVDDFALALQLKPQQLQASYDVLKKHGNMSSPTILFVLKYLIDNTVNPKTNETIFTAAFGPGITLETMQLYYV